MHVVSLKELDTKLLEQIVNRGLEVKAAPERFADLLNGRKLYMLFQKTSTRTALSFALGMNELGGMYYEQRWVDSNFPIGEIQDEVRYVARNVDAIMARLKRHEDISAMARHSPVPVINGCCNRYHPCQGLADMLTIKELFGGFDVRLVYIGIANNVFNALLGSLPRLGGHLTSITPIVNEPSRDRELLETARSTGRFHEVDCSAASQEEIKAAVGSADIVYTDTWVDMEFINDPRFEQANKERMEKMTPFQVSAALLEGSNAVVMHDMPIHAGYEITREVVERHVNVILRQAENRRHAQKALLLTLLEDERIRGRFRGGR